MSNATADDHDHDHPDQEAAGPIDDFIPQVSLHLGDGRPFWEATAGPAVGGTLQEKNSTAYCRGSRSWLKPVPSSGATALQVRIDQNVAPHGGHFEVGVDQRLSPR
jgi:hypothetical protein